MKNMHMAGRESRWWRWTIPLVLAVVLGGGIWTAERRAELVDQELRAGLLSQARSIARAISPESVKALTFTEADLHNPEYQRLCQQLAAYLPAANCMGIYTQTSRADRILFGPETYTPGDPMSSAPGTVYEEPTEANIRLFSEGNAFTQGPYTDEYGTFISAFAPVLDPRTGGVLMAVGLDIEAGEFQAAKDWEWWQTLIWTALLVLVLAVGALLLGVRDALPVAQQHGLRYAECQILGVFGAVLTVLVAVVLHEGEERAARSVFAHLAEAESAQVVDSFHDLREELLGSLARYCAASESMSREDFRRFAGAMARQNCIQALEWAPRIPAEELASIEAAARSDGMPGFQIWQRGPGGAKEPARGREAYFPVRYVVPEEENIAALGYDLGSEQLRFAALSEAMNTGLSCASDAVNLVQDAGPAPEASILVFYPLSAGGEASGRKSDFVIAVLELGGYLRASLGHAGSQATATRADFFLLGVSQEPRFLCSTVDAPIDARSSGQDGMEVLLDRGPALLFPVFSFGRCYVLVVEPGEGFLAAHPLRAGWTAGLAGSVVTIVLIVFTAFLVRRRAFLETEVAARTAELRVITGELESFFNVALDLLCIADVKGNFVKVNRAWEQILGYPRSSLEGQSFLSFVHPDDMSATLEVLSRLGQGDPVMNFINRYRSYDGSYRDVEWRSYPAGNLVYTAARDITARLQSEEAVRRSQKMLSDVLEAASEVAIIATDPDGLIKVFNRGAARMLGYRESEMVGKQTLALIHLEPEIAQRSRELSQELGREVNGFGVFVAKAQREGSERREWTYVRNDGATLPISLVVTAIRSVTGEVTGYLGIAQDITDRRKAEAELLRINEQLEDAITIANAMAARAEQANIAKGEFLANMSHEIRTPMNGVIGMTCLLLETDLNEEQQQYATLVRTSAESLLTLINDILDFSKIEARKVELESIDFDLRLALEDITAIIAVKAHEKAIQLLSMVDPNVPSLLRGDPGRLRQVLLNLCGNAIKFTPQGEVMLRVEVAREDERGALLRFSVKDSGIGISHDKLDSLFSPFTQADASTTRLYGGTGLGLAICRQLVELMGGMIDAESSPGEGSTFWFTAAFEKQQPGESQLPPHLADLQGVRVLVVDDHANNRALVRSLVTQWGCQCEEAEDNPSALAALEAAAQRGLPLQVAIIDVQMPDMPGAELGRRIKENPLLSGIRLIMMTSMGRRGDAARLEQLGFSGYLVKPVRETQLHACLRLVLGAHPAPSDPAPAALVTRHTVSEANKQHARILLVEDNRTNQIVALKILQKLGYRADTAVNGAEALQAMSMTAYDLVFMDCQMPEMDGYEATSRVRDPESAVLNHAIPIIAMTANAMQGDREHCLEVGMNDYVSKPISPGMLAEVLGRWLARGDEAPAPDTSAQ
ncbi:MAG: response regulator [Candidatus Hydrogenedentes bacterium]|nr:response regulator [Candidatus Hydrogenedentota bacterium]